MAFFELRQYTVLPGKMDAWLEYMQTVVIPFQVKQGVVCTGSFRGETDDSVYVWIRRFESEAEFARICEAIYTNDHWKDTILPKIITFVDREKTNVQRLTPTRVSPMQ